MRVNGIEYIYDEIEGINRPTLYPGEDIKDWSCPDDLDKLFRKLNTIIESKYSIEYLKVCAFYNKMFPTLKSCSDWAQTSYNVQPFTYKDQERSDTGTGISANFLKEIIDQITSRLGTIQFVPYLLSEDQNYEFIVYKDEAERILRMYLTKDKLNKKCISIFHDAAILGYSHMFMDPFTGKMIKANDYEISMFESQMNAGTIKHMLYRDYAFPVFNLEPYLSNLNEESRKEAEERYKDKTSVDFCMYFDCVEHKCVVSFDGYFLPEKDYPFDEVLVATMQWDIGMAAVTTTSLFDLLYPMQREINKLNAKEQQLVRNYKGATPVFNSDVELAMKQITNGAGECLYVDSQRPVDTLMTVINPTPLDPELTTKVQEYKSTMYELAGIQNASFDMENMRSAAAVIALDQARDSVFQAQLSGLADFISDVLKLYIKFNAKRDMSEADGESNVDWEAINKLIDTAYISLKPVHLNDPLSDEDASREAESPIDYIQLYTARTVLNIIKGKVTFETLPYYLDWKQITLMMAATLVKFEALGIEVPDTVHKFLISAFVEAVKEGEVDL